MRSTLKIRGEAIATRETLRQLADQLRDEQAELARVWREDRRDAADEDGAPLDAATLASLDRGLADILKGARQAPRPIRA